MYFIYNCKGEVVGNPKGYRTHRGASQQANSWRSKTYKAIWDCFFENKKTNPENKIIHAIKWNEA